RRCGAFVPCSFAIVSKARTRSRSGVRGVSSKTPRKFRLLPERSLEVDRVDDRLSAEVVVGDDVRLALLRHLIDALDPWRELFLRIEIVVALPRLGVGEPLLIVAAMQTRIGDRSRHGGRGLDRIVEERLVDVHPRHVVLAQEREEGVVLKCGVAHFERLRIGNKLTKERCELVARFWRVLEAPGKLQKDCPEGAGAGEWIEVAAERVEVGGLHFGCVMREAAKNLRGELEAAMKRDTPRPALRVCRRRDAVEGRVDLDRVEERGEIRELIEAPAARRIDDSLPVLVAPAGRSDADRKTLRQWSIP